MSKENLQTESQRGSIIGDGRGEDVTEVSLRRDAEESSRKSPTFRWNLVSQSSGSKSKPSKEPATYSHCCMVLVDCLVGLFFSPEDGGNKFHRNVAELLPDYTVSHPRE
jgi:hypothetical protein